MTVVDELVIKIDSDIKGALAGIKSVDTAMNKMDNTIGNSAAGIRKATASIVKSFALVGAAATVALAVGIRQATMTFIDFEQAVTNAASVTGQSGAQYEATKKNIEDLAKTLGETTVFSAQEAASALYDLASAGYDVGNMVTTDLKPILDLAAATQSDLTFATETVTSALGQFGLDIEDSARVSDVLAKSVGDSKSKLDSLSISLRTVGPVANAVGLSIEETVALLGTMFDAGMMGEQAATGLKRAFDALVAPSSTVARTIENLGLTMDDVNPTTREFTDVLDTLKFAGVTTADIFKIFGSEGAAAISILLANTEGVRELESALIGAGGAAKDMADKQLATLGGALTLLKSAVEGVKITIGDFVSDSVKELAVAFRDALPAIEAFITEGLENLMRVIEELAPTWENLKTIFSASIGIIKDVFSAFEDGGGDTVSLVAVLNSLTGALASVFKWIDEHPSVTKLVVAIGTAVVAFGFIVPVISAVGSAIGGILGAFASLQLIWMTTATTGAFIGGVIAALGGPITLIIGAVALLAGAWATNMFGIRDITRDIFGAIRNLFIGLVNFIGPTLETVLNMFIEVFNDLVTILNRAGFNLTEIGELHFKRLSATVEDATNTIADSTGHMSDIISENSETAKESIGSIAEAYNGLDTAVGAASPAAAVGEGMPGWAGKSEYIKERLATTGAKNISGLMGLGGVGGGTAGIVGEVSKIINTQATQSNQLDITSILSQSLATQRSSDSKLSTLAEISAKLDTLKIEVNNYVTKTVEPKDGFDLKRNLSATQSGV